MAFANVLFPTDISRGSLGGPGFNTEVIETDSGFEERIARWDQPRHRFDAGYSIREYSELYVVKRFYYARRGAFESFRYFDWFDHATTPTGTLRFEDDDVVTALDHEIGVGDGSNTTFQLSKKYPDDVLDATRNIVLPVTTPNFSNTVLVAVDGVVQTFGVDYTVNDVTGVVTFTTPPPVNDVVTAGCEFHVKVRFSEAADEWLAMSADDFGSGSASPSIPLVEVRDELPVPQGFFPGGSRLYSNVQASLSVHPGQALVHSLDVQTTSLTVQVPRADDLVGGGAWLVLHNSGSDSIDVETTDAVSLGSLAASGVLVLYLSVDSSGAKTWISK